MNMKLVLIQLMATVAAVNSSCIATEQGKQQGVTDAWCQQANCDTAYINAGFCTTGVPETITGVPTILEHSCSQYTKKNKCKKDETCTWENNKCIEKVTTSPTIEDCTQHKKKKQCKKDETCTWKNKKCIEKTTISPTIATLDDCTQHEKKNKCKKDEKCTWKNKKCIDKTTPTRLPTSYPKTNSPTKKSTKTPTIRGTASPTFSSTNNPSQSPTSAIIKVTNQFNQHESNIKNNVLQYKTPQNQWETSDVYTFSDLVNAIGISSSTGIAGKYLYAGDNTKNGELYGLVNIAAFLAQSMKETIQYNACDENSWDLVNGKYPLANSCGQLGQSYQSYHCSAEEKHMECPVDPDMEITATTNAQWYGAPGPLFCGPKTKYPTVGFWDYSYECNKPWASPPETCNVYTGQKAGKYDNSIVVENTAGRTDVEGCCWWGRGVIQTTGVCNYGKLNYFLGAAAENGKYKDINFCKTPDAICSSKKYPELKWIAGFFYWSESVQSYNVNGWNYMDELKQWVDDEMKNAGSDTGFIHAVSGIVNRGCHAPPCGTGELDGGAERAQNFKKVLTSLGVL